MDNLNFKVDENKCIHCAHCVKDCIAKIIEFDENKIPHITDEGKCIKCQHCLAICPVGAISILERNPEDSDPVDREQNPEKLLNLIKSRRSFRFYKHENLPTETLAKIKNMLNWVPTGVNNHGLHFSFIDDVEVMDEFRNYVNGKVLETVKKKPAHGLMKKFERYIEALKNGEDVIFRGAPNMIVACAPVNSPCVNIDPIIALSYFELYAQSLGVATLWCGFAEACLIFFPELCEKLEIPENYKASYVMLFGPTHAKYFRTTQPAPVGISTVKKGNIKPIGFIQKAKRLFWNLGR